MTTAGGTLNATAAPHWPGPNLDLSLTLTDTTGTTLASTAPPFSPPPCKPPSGQP